jgi:hypothetical protein
LDLLDSGFRRNDGKWQFPTFYEFGMIEKAEMKGIYLGKKADLPFPLNGNGLFYAQHG